MVLETRIDVVDGVEIDGAIFIEGSPTAGAAGILAVNYLREVFDAVLVGEIVSPHFPQISIIDDDGIASRPKLELYLVNVKGLKLLLLSRVFPVESNEGSYELASKLYQFLARHNVNEYLVLASGRVTGDGSVFVSTTSLDQSKALLDAGAKRSPSLETLPVDRVSGFLMLFFARDGKKVSMLFSDSASYIPDNLAARRLLEVVSRYLGIEVDFKALDTEIEKQARAMQEVEQLGLTGRKIVSDEKPSKEPFYIG